MASERSRPALTRERFEDALAANGISLPERHHEPVFKTAAWLAQGLDRLRAELDRSGEAADRKP